MKVVIAIPCLLHGGTEIQTLQLVRVLVSCGYEVTTICYHENTPSMVRNFKKAQSEVLLLNWSRSFSGWLFVSKFVRILKKISPQVVHVQYMAPGGLPIIAARLAGIKRILATVHQPLTRNHGPIAKYTLRFSALFCDRFIAVSQNAEISWFGSGRFYDEYIGLKNQCSHFTIYNSIDTGLITKLKSEVKPISIKHRLNISDKIQVIGVVSRLSEEKGVDLLIDAFYRLQKEYESVHLLIVGNGKDGHSLKESVRQQKMMDRVTFYGNAEWKVAMQLMGIMDVVVVPSRYEGFGLTAAEAIAMGKYVVASNVYGLKEIVLPSNRNILFESENSIDLYNKLKISVDRSLVESDISEVADYIMRFDIKTYHRKITSLYRDLE